METNNIKTIKVLPLEKMFFLKKINLDDSFSSIVCYARKVSNNYKLHPEKQNNGEHLYLGYREEEYPRDELDIKILRLIQEKFPDAKVETSLMMLDVEKEDNKRWLNQYNKESLRVIVEYVSTQHHMFAPQPYSANIEVLYSPVINERHKRLNTNLYLLTERPEEYTHLQSLMEHTYTLYTRACE